MAHRFPLHQDLALWDRAIATMRRALKVERQGGMPDSLWDVVDLPTAARSLSYCAADLARHAALPELFSLRSVLADLIEDPGNPDLCQEASVGLRKAETAVEAIKGAVAVSRLVGDAVRDDVARKVGAASGMVGAKSLVWVGVRGRHDAKAVKRFAKRHGVPCEQLKRRFRVCADAFEAAWRNCDRETWARIDDVVERRDREEKKRELRRQ